MSTMPNQALERTGLSLWVWPWGFWFAHVRTPVAILGVRRGAHSGRFERLNRRQRREQRWNRASVSSVTSCRIWRPRRFAPMTRADFFSCVSRVSRLRSHRSGEAGCHCKLVGVGRRFLRFCENSMAEPTCCSEPRESVWVAIRTSVARGR